MKKLFITLVASALIVVAPLTISAQELLWTNPTSYHSLPSGLVHPIGDANKSERLVRGHAYKVSFDAAVAGSENVLLLYTQNRSYLNEFIQLGESTKHYEFTFYAKTNTKVVFEDLQHFGDINIENISIVLVK